MAAHDGISRCSAKRCRMSRSARERPFVLLLVDDELVHHKLVEAALSRAAARPLEIVHASRPAEALALLGSLPPGDLAVLSDHDLGARRSGAELLREIAALRPGALRFLYSSRPREVLLEETRGDGIDAIFEKPLDLRPFADAFWRFATRGGGGRGKALEEGEWGGTSREGPARAGNGSTRD